jgi:hypothetical protein
LPSKFRRLLCRRSPPSPQAAALRYRATRAKRQTPSRFEPLLVGSAFETPLFVSLRFAYSRTSDPAEQRKLLVQRYRK